MYLYENFGVDIISSNARYEGDKLFSLPYNPNGEVYSIKMINQMHRRCDCQVFNNGYDVGTFRVNSYGTIVIDHPVNDHGQFTLFPKGTSGAIAGGQYLKSDVEHGLLELHFYPEKLVKPIPLAVNQVYKDVTPGEERHSYSGDNYIPKLYTCCSGSNNVSFESAALRGGITALTGHSNQQFGYAENIIRDQPIIIKVRLVVREQQHTQSYTVHPNDGSRMPRVY